MEFQTKVVLITGASRGIGEAAARIFAQAGAKVVLTARSDRDISRIASEIGGLAIPCDVSDWTSVSSAVDTAVAEFGGLDVLINNAGVLEPVSHLIEADPGDWDKVIDINLKGVFYGMRAAVPALLKRGGGTVLTVSSGAAHGPMEGWSHYCASKAGAAMLTRSLHLETADRGIRVMGLSPGTVATQMQKDIKASGVNPVSKLEWDDHIPAEWPAQALRWMCTPAADPWLGQEIKLRDPEIRDALGLPHA